MGAHDGLPPLDGFPTLYDRKERALQALGRNKRPSKVRISYKQNDTATMRMPRWHRQELHQRSMQELDQLSPLNRAAHGVALKMLRRLMVEYRKGAPSPSASRSTGVNQHAVHHVDLKEFAKLVARWANQLLLHGCHAKVVYDPAEHRLLMTIKVSREPRLTPPPVTYYTLDLV